MIFIIFIAIAIASYAVQASLENKFKRYSRIPVNGNLTGAQVAERMLREHGIYNVQVTQTDGHLTDHYNPMTQTVNLSREVYYGNSVASAAVAAHECGHALQHATGYSMLRLRSNLVPAVNFSSKLLPWLLLGGILTISVFPQLLLVGIILYAVTTLFTLVTLPVEIDASRRATLWLQRTGITSGQTQEQAKDALKSAAYTYVVAAISSLATLIYYILIYTSRRE